MYMYKVGAYRKLSLPLFLPYKRLCINTGDNCNRICVMYNPMAMW